jgi:hypothetical protein
MAPASIVPLASTQMALAHRAALNVTLSRIRTKLARSTVSTAIITAVKAKNTPDAQVPVQVSA